MPKASVNENGDSVFRESDVRLAWDIPPMQPVSVSEFVKSPSHNEFWIRVTRPDARHIPASALHRKFICHGKQSRRKSPIAKRW
jgi:hypothetical protein